MGVAEPGIANGGNVPRVFPFPVRCALVLALAATLSQGAQKRLAGRFVVLECLTEREAEGHVQRLFDLMSRSSLASRYGYVAHPIHTSDVRGFAPRVYATIVGPFADYASAARAQRKLRRSFRYAYVKKGDWNGRVYVFD